MTTEADRLTEETGDTWTGVRRDTFLQIYGATRQARENIIDALNAPKDIPAGGLSIPERPATVPSGYLNWGVSFTRVQGSDTVDRNIHPFRSAEPLTPEEVENLIRDQIIESSTETHGTFSGVFIEGIAFTGTQQLVRDARA